MVHVMFLELYISLDEATDILSLHSEWQGSDKQILVDGILLYQVTKI